jgi:hypothetical protein
MLVIWDVDGAHPTAAANPDTTDNANTKRRFEVLFMIVPPRCNVRSETPRANHATVCSVRRSPKVRDLRIGGGQPRGCGG